MDERTFYLEQVQEYLWQLAHDIEQDEDCETNTYPIVEDFLQRKGLE